MVTVEYGKENSGVIVLLHGGGLSWWNFREAAQRLKHRYHVVIPILDGHAGSDRNFSDIGSCAEALIEHIDRVHGGSVLLIGGVSLGGQILAEMLVRRGDICSFAILESVSVIPARLAAGLIKPAVGVSYGLIRRKWFSRLQFKALGIPEALYPEYCSATRSMTKENLTAVLQANSRYALTEKLAHVQAKVRIFVGGKEGRRMIRSARRLNRLIPGSGLSIMAGRSHGEFCLSHAAEYAAVVMDMLEAAE